MKIAHVFANDHFEVRGKKIIKSSIRKGYSITEVLKVNKKQKYPFFMVEAIIKLLKEKPNIIHAHRISGFVPSMLVKILRPQVKLIYDKHDTHKYDLFFDHLIFLSDAVLTNSELHLKKIKKYLKNKISYVLHNYSFFKPLSKMENLENRKRYGLKKRDFLILFQGSISSLSNPLKLIEAIKKIEDKNLKLIIVGWILNKELKKKIQESLGERIIYLKPVPYNEMKRIISMSDVGTVMFEKSEITEMGDPNKLWEFMACKKPIIVTDVYSVSSVVKKYNNGIVVKNISEIVSAIKDLRNKKRYGDYVKNIPSFSWSNQFEDYNKIIRILLKK